MSVSILQETINISDPYNILITTEENSNSSNCRAYQYLIKGNIIFDDAKYNEEFYNNWKRKNENN